MRRKSKFILADNTVVFYRGFPNEEVTKVRVIRHYLDTDRPVASFFSV